jgi:protein-S-isoprenylcysteine O-methyltransferase Ste14
MITTFYLSAAMLSIIVVFYLVDFNLIRRYDRQRQASGSGRSWDFTLMAFTAGAVLVLQPIFLPQLGWSSASNWGLGLQICGMALAGLGIGLHYWARTHLRQFYAERVEVQPEHRVIDTGPYALVRHPVITSFFSIATGLFMLNPAVTTLLIMIYTFWDFSRAARQEEELLGKTLPDYPGYMERTPRFIPRLWRKR